MSAPGIVAVVGNPRPNSRTHGIALTLAGAISASLVAPEPSAIDLATFGPRVLDPADAGVKAAVDVLLAADIVVVASPTYKATYTGLLKSFLDRVGTGALDGATAIPLLVGGAPNHQLAVDVHLVPLLLELGASVPVRGLFVLDSEAETFDATARVWALQHQHRLTSAGPALTSES